MQKSGSKLNCKASASTSASSSNLQYSEYNAYLYEDGRLISQGVSSKKTKFTTDWSVAIDTAVYEMEINGVFQYYDSSPDYFNDADSYSNLYGKSVDSARISTDRIKAIDTSVRDKLVDTFNISTTDFSAIDSRDLKANLCSVNGLLNLQKGDTKPAFLIDASNSQLVALKQDINGVDYLYTFSLDKENVELINVQTVQGALIDTVALSNSTAE